MLNTSLSFGNIHDEDVVNYRLPIITVIQDLLIWIRIFSSTARFFLKNRPGNESPNILKCVCLYVRNRVLYISRKNKFTITSYLYSRGSSYPTICGATDAFPYVFLNQSPNFTDIVSYNLKLKSNDRFIFISLLNAKHLNSSLNF